MIKIENLTVYGFEEAIRGMRNPKNSWDKSDSYHTHIEDTEAPDMPIDSEFHVGDADKDLMMRLAKGGPVHAKYRRYIDVYVDITAPLYWWKEFETYRVGVCDNPSDIEFNSCSTMHKIAAKEFTLDDFSHEHLLSDDDYRMDNFEAFLYEDNQEVECPRVCRSSPLDDLKDTIAKLNLCRRLYLDESIKGDRKIYWLQMIQLLPSSYNQKRTVKLNYEVLAGMWKYRNSHKLDEWVKLMEYFKENCPHSEIFTTDFRKQEREDLIREFSEYMLNRILGGEDSFGELEFNNPDDLVREYFTNVANDYIKTYIMEAK